MAADLFPGEGGPSEVAGDIKLQLGWGGYWKKTTRERFFNLPGLETWAKHEYLTYEPTRLIPIPLN